MEVRLKGIGVSPGIAIGPAVTYHVQSIDVPRYTIEDPTAELERYDRAADQSRAELTRLRDQTAEELGERHADLLSAHILMLDDVALRPEIEQRIKDERVNAEYLVDELISGYARLMQEIDDPMFRERTADFVDVGRRILSNLLERELENLEYLETPCVVVAHELSPTEMINIDETNTLGLATDAGGPTSHMAILARAFEIPTVVGLTYMGTHVAADDTIIVDGTRGDVVIRPAEETLTRYRARQERYEEQRLALIQAEHAGPGVTLDDHEISTFANIELLPEIAHSLKANCQGIGLYRTEYLFMESRGIPTEEEQYELYRQVVEAVQPLPVTFRTLDLGGDKIVASLFQEKEANPQLGWRSIRFCLDRPDVFKAQLRALLRASVHGNMQIMFPMISGLDQLRDAKTIVEEVKVDLKARGVAFDPDIKLGTMIEVPSAAGTANALAQECDFFSIGSNDLIQYCLAVDRVNKRTAHLYQPTHPGVLYMLKQTIDAAKKAGIPCSICGEMAGDPLVTELLIGLGFDSLSMSSVSLPRVRAEIANTRLSSAKRFARKILSTGSASEIHSILLRRRESRGTMKLYKRRQAQASDA